MEDKQLHHYSKLEDKDKTFHPEKVFYLMKMATQIPNLMQRGGAGKTQLVKILYDWVAEV